MQIANDSNGWIEESISKKNIKHYDYKHFCDFQEIGNDAFSKVYRVNRKNLERHLLENQRKVGFHNNVNFIHLYGITVKEDQNDQLNKYLITEYVDGNSLQTYLKYPVLCLHEDEILRHDLNTYELADLRLFKQRSDSFEVIPYINPKSLNNSNNLMQLYSLDKSDLYSIGALLWEVTNGQSQDYRETIVSSIPIDYSNLYFDNWLATNQNSVKLTITTRANMMIECYQTDINYKLYKSNPQLSGNHPDNVKISNNNNSLREVIQNFNKTNIKEIEPTTQYINEYISEEDLSIVIDEFVDLYFEKVNEGKEEKVRKQYVLDFINNHKINLREIYHWLLNNQNNSNSIYSLGYFNYHGIETNINKRKAFELYQKAVELECNVVQFDLANMYMDGEGVNKNYNKAFELSKKLAIKEYPGGINLLGYCYDNGIGTDVDKHKAFELYQKATNLGNSIAQCNLALSYTNGEGVDQNYDKAFELFKKLANGNDSYGINSLGYCYENGFGTDVDKQEAFKLYQKAANLGNDVAQYNLACTYEYGEEIEKDMDKAIYWYKKSAEQNYQHAKDKLKELLIK